jgi:hypothetical protein
MTNEAKMHGMTNVVGMAWMSACTLDDYTAV